jgi:hypothetical protein
MLSGGKHMVLNVEQHIPSVGVTVPGQTRPLKITGTVDYAALMTDSREHRVSSLSVCFIVLSVLQRVIHQKFTIPIGQAAEPKWSVCDRSKAERSFTGPTCCAGSSRDVCLR